MMELETNPTGMVYHSELKKLTIPEYGRNIHRMVEYCLSLTDRNERSRCAVAIVDTMQLLHAQNRDLADLKRKLWDHLHVMADFRLDVDSPFPAPSREAMEKKAEKLNYPAHEARFRHYGTLLEDLVEKAIEMEDGDLKNALIEQIANQMKRFYLTWNRDSVADEVIFEQLRIMSKGRLKPREEFRLSHAEATRNVHQQQQARRGKNHRNNRSNRRRY